MTETATTILETIYRLDGPLRWAVGEAYELCRKTRVGPGATVLDVGAGTGYLSIPLAGLVGANGSVHSLDICPELLDRLRQKALRKGCAQRINVKTGSAVNLGYPANSFDFVFSSYTLHELDDPEAALQEMHRVLKPSGQIAISDYRRIEDDERRLEIESWYNRQADQFGHSEEHLRYSLAALDRMLVSVGFSEIALSTWMDFHMHAVATKYN